MAIQLISVNKDKQSPTSVIVSEYAKRIPWKLELIEVEAKKGLGGVSRKEAEGKLILDAVHDKAFMVALDEKGKTYTSQTFANQLGKWQENQSHLAFIIGGADGFSDELRQRAHTTIAFGAMTWPHKMARAMLVEQLYRAHTIQTGHPYHRE